MAETIDFNKGSTWASET